MVCSVRMPGQTLLFNTPPRSLRCWGKESSLPWSPREESGEGSPHGWGKAVQLLLQGCRTPPKVPEHRGCSGSCKEKGDRVLLGSPMKPLPLGKLPKATRRSQLAVARIAWGCLSPARAAGVRGETVPAHITYLLWKTVSIHFRFSSASYCTICRPTAAFLFARHGPKLCFPPFRIMFLWGLFPTSFANCNNLISRGHFFHPTILHRSHNLLRFSVPRTQLKVNCLLFSFTLLYFFLGRKGSFFLLNPWDLFKNLGSEIPAWNLVQQSGKGGDINIIKYKFITESGAHPQI